MANICRRARDAIVPWNIFSVEVPQDLPDKFPKIDDVSDEHIFTITEAIVDGQDGLFSGPFSFLLVFLTVSAF